MIQGQIAPIKIQNNVCVRFLSFSTSISYKYNSSSILTGICQEFTNQLLLYEYEEISGCFNESYVYYLLDIITNLNIFTTFEKTLYFSIVYCVKNSPDMF